MTVINEVYDPLIEAARSNAPNGQELLAQLGAKLHAANPDRCQSVEEGLATAKRNLIYYAQCFPSHVAHQVKVYYGLE
jgi:hypothetical protein